MNLLGPLRRACQGLIHGSETAATNTLLPLDQNQSIKTGFAELISFYQTVLQDYFTKTRLIQTPLRHKILVVITWRLH